MRILLHRSAESFSVLASAVRNDNVRRAELAWGAAIAAEWAHFVALGVFAYDRGGASAVGLAGLIRLLPAAVVAPFAASFGDRFRRERFLLALALTGSAALAGSAFAAFAGVTPLVYALAALVGVCVTLFRPALQALLPSLARTPQELIASNGATSTVESIGTLVAPLLAGVLVAVANVGTVFLVGTGTLAAAAVLLSLVNVEGRIDAGVTGREDESDEGRLIVAGISAVARGSRPRLLVGLVVAQTFVRGCLNVLIVVAAFRVFHGGAAEVGYLTAAIGVGGLVGALAAMKLRARQLAARFGLALVLWGLPIVLIAPRPYLVAAMFLLAVVGFANSVEDVSFFTLLQRTVPDDILTGVLGTVWGLAMGGVAIGSIAAPSLVRAVGPRPAFVIVGAILPILSVLAHRRLLEIDESAVPGEELDLIEAIPMFRPLPIATKERLAAKLVPLSVSAGELVVRTGDAAQSFYIVHDGELDVDASGRHASAQAGDYFGEIALLRDVPRTATVTAVSDSHLYSLQRDAFLAAVTGHSAAHAAGEEVAEARLAGAP